MLTLEQLISEATALPDAGKAILIDKIVESMAARIDSSACFKGVHEVSLKENQDVLTEGVRKAQERLAEIDSGVCNSLRFIVNCPH
jgi:hypothetical protein